MINLEDYIIQYDALNSIDFMEEAPINEGKITNGIKKLWKWIKKKFSNDEDVSYYLDKKDRNVTYEIKELDYNDIYKLLSDTSKDTQETIKENKSHLKFLIVNVKKTPVGLFAYVENEYSPYKDINEFYKFYHIYAIDLMEKLKFDTIIDLFIEYLHNKNSKLKGFTVDKKAYKAHKQDFKDLGFEESNKNVIYCYYEDIERSDN